MIYREGTRVETSPHVDTHDGPDASVLRMQVGQLLEGEARTDVGVDDKELFEVGKNGITDCDAES